MLAKTTHRAVDSARYKRMFLEDSARRHRRQMGPQGWVPRGLAKLTTFVIRKGSQVCQPRLRAISIGHTDKSALLIIIVLPSWLTPPSRAKHRTLSGPARSVDTIATNGPASLRDLRCLLWAVLRYPVGTLWSSKDFYVPHLRCRRRYSEKTE